MTADHLFLALGVVLIVWNVAQFAVAVKDDSGVGVALGFVGLFCGALLVFMSVPGVTS